MSIRHVKFITTAWEQRLVAVCGVMAKKCFGGGLLKEMDKRVLHEAQGTM